MASISGTFTADGYSLVLSGVSGNVDIGVKLEGAAAGSVRVLVSYDGGTTYFRLEGGSFDQVGGDRIMIAGDSALYYKLQAVGVSGNIHYYMGAS